MRVLQAIRAAYRTFVAIAFGRIEMVEVVDGPEPVRRRVEVIESLRLQYGMNKRTWANFIGMNPVCYTNFTHNRRGMTVQQLARCYELGAPADALLGCATVAGGVYIPLTLKEQPSV